MAKIKGILSIWLLKYWYLLLFCLVLAYGLFYFFKHNKQEGFFICKMMGSTYMLSGSSISEYMEPFDMAIKERDYKSVDRLIGVKEDVSKKIKTIVYAAQSVIEEQNIRYEYRIIITTNDTVGFSILENALVNYLSNHALVQENFNNKVKKFKTDTSLIQADLRRVDSTAATLKNKQIEFYETLMQKKVDLKLQLSKTEGKFNENYIHKKIYGFNTSTTKVDPSTDSQKVTLLQWLLIFTIVDFILVFAINKNFRQLILS
ncbi:MAG: hypothetical protein NT150_08820 [Bacteroidetes bacterium]|nr:hypothetical protein [Bacteroidota bacterium]